MNTAFDASHLLARERFRPAYGQLASALTLVLDFETVVDVGAGQGFLIDAMLDCNKRPEGIELSPDAQAVASDRARPLIHVGDARQVSGSYDLACCIEVAEHIPPSDSVALVQALAGLAPTLVFTAATPYQPGHGHINCRPTFDWLYWFRAAGMHLDFDATVAVKRALGGCEAAPWIAMNILVFRRVS